jgi:hypothetical protein
MRASGSWPTGTSNRLLSNRMLAARLRAWLRYPVSAFCAPFLCRAQGRGPRLAPWPSRAMQKQNSVPVLLLATPTLHLVG